MMSYTVSLTSALNIVFESGGPSDAPLHERAQLVERHRARIEARRHHLYEDECAVHESLPSSPPPPQEWYVVLEWATEPGLGQFSAMQMAHAQGRIFEGDYYTFLMSHGVSSKTDSYVGYTTNPLRDVYLHNERRISDRNTAAAAGNWELDVVLGPFACKALAVDCGNAWVHGTRGKLPKRKKAPFLSKAYNVNMYDCRKRLHEPFDTYLERTTQPVYGQVWQEHCK